MKRFIPIAALAAAGLLMMAGIAASAARGITVKGSDTMVILAQR